MSDIRVGDIVQIKPETHRMHFFRAQLIIVTEVKTWGIQGYSQAENGQAFVRVKTEDFYRVGRAKLIADDGGWSVLPE